MSGLSSNMGTEHKGFDIQYFAGCEFPPILHLEDYFPLLPWQYFIVINLSLFEFPTRQSLCIDPSAQLLL